MEWRRRDDAMGQRRPASHGIDGSGGTVDGSQPGPVKGGRAEACAARLSLVPGPLLSNTASEVWSDGRCGQTAEAAVSSEQWWQPSRQIEL